MLTSFKFPLPPLDEQRRIADYLDHETAEIDATIHLQQELLIMTDQRRESYISRITHPKTSETWPRGQLKRFLRLVTDGAHIAPETENGIMPFVSTRDVHDGLIDIDNALRTTRASYEYMARTGCVPQEGDVLFSKDGTVGATAVVPFGEDFAVASSLVILRPIQHLLRTDYLNFVLQSKQIKFQAELAMRGAGLPRISVSNVGKLTIPLPPVTQQRLIADAITNELDDIENLREVIIDFIALAKERRAALISAAVTGKITV